MFKKRWIFMFSLMSLSALADVSFQEKKNRVEFLEQLTGTPISMDIAAYRRELKYEKENLPLDVRAENEASLLAEDIKNVVIKAYEASMKSHGDVNQALKEINAQIEKDSELIDPALREEIKRLSQETLEGIQRGQVNSETKLENVQKVFLKGVQERSEFLNKEAELILPTDMRAVPGASLDRNRLNYNAKSEIVASLVSEFNNADLSATSTTMFKSDVVSTRIGNISLQVKVEFLGSSISAGPQIIFKREIKTLVDINAEGLNPVLLHDGNFDFHKRDGLNRIVKVNGKDQRRKVNFGCDASLVFETDYAGGGGFAVAGMGASGTVSKKYGNTVTLASRRIAVPEYIDSKTTTLKTLMDLCHRDFLKARITSNMTVESSLNVMMKNAVSSIKFSHPKTKCATDNHCVNWYNKQVLPLWRVKNYPRCVEESREKYFSCELRGLQGQNCALYDRKGKRITDGLGEFKCDKGLRCVQVQEAGWFKGMDLYQAAKGRCMPTNPKTYKSPLEKNYIDVYLVN